MADDGWTQVPRKTKPGVNFSRPLPPSPRATTTNIDRPNPASRDITLENITADYQRKSKTWQQSQCRQATIRILDRIKPDEGWKISTAVCLASGSFSRDNMESRRRSMWQMVIFKDLANQLGKEVKLVAQEPAYTPLDRDFLTTLNVEVLNVGDVRTIGLGPAAQYLGKETFVFEPFLDMDAAMLKQISEAELALYVGSSVRGLMGRNRELGQLAMRFHEKHRMYNFPEFEVDPNVLGGMGFYWREEDENEG